MEYAPGISEMVMLAASVWFYILFNSHVNIYHEHYVLIMFVMDFSGNKMKLCSGLSRQQFGNNF